MDLISTESEYIAKDELLVLSYIMAASVNELVELMNDFGPNTFDCICLQLVKHRLETIKRTEESMLSQLRYHIVQKEGMITDLTIKFAELNDR
jgi:hypothetical protein